MDVILLALENETFSYHGAYYDFPPPGIPDRGGQVEQLTSGARPLYLYEIWQPITSPRPSSTCPPASACSGCSTTTSQAALAALRRDLRGAASTALAPGRSGLC